MPLVCFAESILYGERAKEESDIPDFEPGSNLVCGREDENQS
jgi:hypothetical protein